MSSPSASREKHVFVKYIWILYTLCWNAESCNCDKLKNYCILTMWVLHANIWLYTTVGLWKVYLKRAFVCLLSKPLKTCSSSKPLMHQIKGRNKTITWQSETGSLFRVTQLISICIVLISRFCHRFIFPGCNTAILFLSDSPSLLIILCQNYQKLIYTVYIQHIPVTKLWNISI